MKEHFQYMRVQFFIEVYKTCHSTLIQLDDNNLWKLDFIEFKVLPQTVMFWSLTASSFPQHSITLLTLNQSRCRVMKQEIVRKRNESISTIIIFICRSLERLARQRQQQMNVLPIFFCHLLEDLRRFLFFICLV